MAAAGGHAIQGYYWGVTHDVFVWSPKGFLTGDRSTFGSVLFGWAFQKAAADCGSTGSVGTGSCIGSQGFRQNVLSDRELGLYYYIQRGTRIGINWNWYRAKNMSTANQLEVGCSSNTSVVSPANGKSCDWHAITLILHANF